MSRVSGDELPERYVFTDLTADPDLDLVVEGLRDELPEVHVEFDVDSDWRVRHPIERINGVWTPARDPVFMPRHGKTRAGGPTVRQRKAGSLDRHRQRLDDLLRTALDEDEEIWREKATWSEVVSHGWRVTAPRSRRGRAAEIDTDEVERLREEGLTYRQIEQKTGALPKSASNKVSKNKRRTPQ